MKHPNQIMAMISHLNADIVENEHKHSKLNQIDMLSGEGNMLREKINKAKGMRDALEWVINEGQEELINDME